jgi:ABC-2 type transport system permease protein
MGLLLSAWFLVIGLVFGVTIEGGVPGVLLVLALIPLAAIAFGSVGAAIAIAAGRASVVQGIFPLVLVVIFLSSAFFPRELLLEPARSIADYNPMSFIAEGVREPIVAGLDAGHTLKALLGVAIVAGIGAVGCTLGMRRRLRA